MLTEVSVRLPRASFSAPLSASSVRRFNEQLGLEMKYSDFIPLLCPRETLPSDGVRLPADNLQNAYTVN